MLVSDIHNLVIYYNIYHIHMIINISITSTWEAWGGPSESFTGGGPGDVFELLTLLDLCVTSLRRGHANILCVVPMLTDDLRRESTVLGMCLQCLLYDSTSIGWHCLSNATCLIRPHLFYAPFIVLRVTVLCRTVHHF